MTNIKKIGLSALAGALAMTSAHAGSLAVSGAMEISYTKGSGKIQTGNPLGQANDMSFTASTELDNGVTVAYKRSVTDAFAADDSELVFGNLVGSGTIAFQSTGSPLDGIDNKTPTAFKDAEGMTGSINDVSGANGDFGIRYTLSDVMGSGIKLDYNYVPVHGSGDATGDEGYSATTKGTKDAHDITLTGAVPGVEGLNLGVGYSKRNYDMKEAGSPDTSREDGTAYVTYAVGGLTLGYQVGAHGAVGKNTKGYKNTYLGVSYAVSDDFSISYNSAESFRTGSQYSPIQDWDSVSASYSMGGMTINVADSSCDNCSYVGARTQSETTLSMTVAF